MVNTSPFSLLSIPANSVTLGTSLVTFLLAIKKSATNSSVLPNMLKSLFLTLLITGFNNSVIVDSYRYDAAKMTDLNSLYTLFKKDSFTTHKGMLALWNQRKLVNTPLLNMTELQNSILYVNGPEGKFRYSVPYEIGMPIIVENLATDIEKPGIDSMSNPAIVVLPDTCKLPFTLVAFRSVVPITPKELSMFI